MSGATVQDLAGLVGGRVVGDGDRRIAGVGDLRSAGPDEIGFVRDPKHVALIAGTRAGAVVVGRQLEVDVPQVVVADPAVAFARIAEFLHPRPRATEHAVHPSAVLGRGVELEEPVRIGPHVAIGDGVRIGAGTIVDAGTTVGDAVSIGRDVLLHARVTIYAGCRLGDRVVVHSGTVIGSDGFGFARDRDGWIKVPQVGDVVVEDDVEIGANCTIDRGALGTTRIGRGTKLDNLIHVGHNSAFGEHCVVAALSAFAGSTLVGARCTIGGHVVTKGHQRIVDDVRIGGASGVQRDLLEPGDYMGYPILDKRAWIRTLGALERLPDTVLRLRELERRLGGDA